MNRLFSRQRSNHFVFVVFAGEAYEDQADGRADKGRVIEQVLVQAVEPVQFVLQEKHVTAEQDGGKQQYPSDFLETDGQ